MNLDILTGVLGSDYEEQDCLLARSLEVVGERWTLLIVRDAFFGVQRFSDFLTRLDIPKAVLASRLRGLVEEGIMKRRPDPERPGVEVYELTGAGEDLWPVVYALRSWGARHRAPDGVRLVYRHVPCGRMLDRNGSCPGCKKTPRAAEVSVSAKGGEVGKRRDHVSMRLAKPRRLLEPLGREPSGRASS